VASQVIDQETPERYLAPLVAFGGPKCHDPAHGSHRLGHQHASAQEVHALSNSEGMTFHSLAPAPDGDES